jgi:hypothetical protein
MQYALLPPFPQHVAAVEARTRYRPGQGAKAEPRLQRPVAHPPATVIRADSSRTRSSARHSAHPSQPTLPKPGAFHRRALFSSAVIDPSFASMRSRQGGLV